MLGRKTDDAIDGGETFDGSGDTIDGSLNFSFQKKIPKKCLNTKILSKWTAKSD